MSEQIHLPSQNLNGGLRQFSDEFDVFFSLLDHSTTNLSGEFDKRDKFRREFAAMRPESGTIGRIEDFYIEMERLLKVVSAADNGDVDEVFSKNYDELAKSYPGDDIGAGLRAYLAASAPGRSRADVMARSLLISAVAAFENLARKALSALLLARPGVLSKHHGGREYSYAEISEHLTIEDFKARVVDDVVDSWLREAVGSWIDRFSIWGIKRDGIVDDWATFDEIFLRRNIVVHNGGVVNRHYFKSVGGENIGMNTYLPIDKDYLTDSLEQLLATGFLVAQASVRAGGLSFPESNVPPLGAVQVSYDLLRMGRHRALGSYYRLARLGDLSEQERLMMQVNWWISVREVRGSDAIFNEVEAWETDHLAEKFTLARLCLLGRHEEAVALALKLQVEGYLTPNEYAVWPLLRDTRRWQEANEVQLAMSLDPEGDE